MRKLTICLCHLIALINLSMFEAIAQDTVIPDNLSAEKLMSLGYRYQQNGQPEQARKCLKMAIAKDPSGQIGKRAKKFLESNIPKFVVPPEAVADNVNGYNLLVNHKTDSAITLFEDTIATYPRFEWPYHNLAIIYLEKKNTRLAKAYETKALAINPKYAAACAGMANAYILEKNFPAAKDYATKSLQLDPDNRGAAQMLRFLQQRSVFQH